MVDDIKQRLVEAGAQRAAARARAVELSGEIDRLARQALDAGVTKFEIAKLAQISRTALDAMLDGDAP